MASDTPAMWTGSSAASRSMTRSHSVSPGNLRVGWGTLPAQPLTGAFRELLSANEASSENNRSCCALGSDQSQTTLGRNSPRVPSLGIRTRLDKSAQCPPTHTQHRARPKEAGSACSLLMVYQVPHPTPAGPASPA